MNNILFIDGVDVKHGDGITYVENYQPQKAESESSGGKSIVALCSGEVGGSNSMSPLYTAPLVNLPVIDCDGMGRAFPELQVQFN